VLPLQQHSYCTAAALREKFAALSGISRASRFAKMSIQRFLGCFPLAISADYVQKVQYLQQNLHFELS